jgi:nucleotidyltransferase substrate binding protein (TIGR01987 family)
MIVVDTPDIRWKQRFQNYKKALLQLENAVTLTQIRDLTPIEIQGLIKSFEFTHELAWNVIKDFFNYQGNTTIMGSRDATREAFQYGLIQDGDLWMEMIKSRNQTSHTYNEETAQDISNRITQLYLAQFKELDNTFSKLCNDA